MPPPATSEHMRPRAGTSPAPTGRGRKGAASVPSTASCRGGACLRPPHPSTCDHGPGQARPLQVADGRAPQAFLQQPVVGAGLAPPATSEHMRPRAGASPAPTGRGRKGAASVPSTASCRGGACLRPPRPSTRDHGPGQARPLQVVDARSATSSFNSQFVGAGLASARHVRAHATTGRDKPGPYILSNVATIVRPAQVRPLQSRPVLRPGAEGSSSAKTTSTR